MRLIINESAQQGSVWAARHIVEAIKAKAAKTSEPFVLGLPTGGTPIATYKELIRMYEAGEVSFKNVITFNMDEYVGLPVEHPESYHSFMFRNFFDHVDVPRENINILNGLAEDLEAECANYEARIKAAGGIDLFLGGVGEDGHIAFNEPYTSLQSRTHCQQLTYDTILVNSRFFDDDLSKVPTKALTVGVATVMDSKEVMILTFGHKKARAVAAAIEAPMSHACTLSALQNHPNGVIVADELACGEIKVNTYKFFKEQAGNVIPAAPLEAKHKVLMKIKIIVAAALNGAIGRNNDLMWHIDLRFFKATTMGHPVIMGRKTFESIGRPLPGRRNIVISRGEPVLPDGVELAHSLDQALEMLGDAAEPFVIGGGQIYAQAMNRASELYVTRVFCSPEDADTFFPEIDPDIWKLEDEGEVLHDEASGLDYSFLKYIRR